MTATPAPPRTAILSVSDKTGLVDLAKALAGSGFSLVASGGTAGAIRKAGIPVKDVSDMTQAAEMLGGRVKTLHPAVHGGILAQDTPSDQADMKARGYDYIDLVVCNLYPFQKTIAKQGVTMPEAVEEIDIGGVTLLRAAAKNHARVAILSSPSDYTAFLKELAASKTGAVSEATRQRLALKAFSMTADYDEAISGFLRHKYAGPEAPLTDRAMMPLRYGCNPHQKPASVFSTQGPLPFKVHSGAPGYINLLDAFNSWPLVKELSAAAGLPAAASFKHVSPAGVALGLPITHKSVYGVEDLSLPLTPLACAYARARGADRMSSFGDWIALSHECDEVTARIISREVSDGIIAPGYAPAALALLQKKKGGKYCVLEVDPAYEPAPMERRMVYGMWLEQKRNAVSISADLFAGPADGPRLTPAQVQDLLVATTALKYTQSNSVCYAKEGMTVGLGAGQQSRIHCTRLAGAKADNWWLRHHPRLAALPFKPAAKRAERANAIDALVSGGAAPAGLFAGDAAPPALTDLEVAEWQAQLTGVVVSSDAFFPFPDNVVRAAASGVQVIAAPSGSVMDDVVAKEAKRLGMTMVFTDLRLFHH